MLVNINGWHRMSSKLNEDSQSRVGAKITIVL